MRILLRFFLSCIGIFLVILIRAVPCQARPAADSLQISLITCGPGHDLYSTFGHTAVRVIDFSSGGDYAFNYGTFDFSTPHFYWKFTRGRLMYFLSVQDFPSFIQTYKAENRKVTEQVLNLTSQEKQEVWQFLKTNYLPENRYYKYDFLFDNCSTRIRDIFSKTFGSSWQVENIIPVEGLSFRDIINDYLKYNPWEKLGINLVFGKTADEEMTNDQIMFLPDYLMQGIGHSIVNGKPLVKRTLTLYTPDNVSASDDLFYEYPLFWLTLISLVIILLSLTKPSHFSIAVLPWVDRCLFFLTGLLGCFLLFMWFGTDHKICAWNFNLLWLFPLNIVFSFYFYKNSRVVRGYSVFILLLCVFLIAGWFMLPQQLPLAAIPVIAAIVVRSWSLLTRQQPACR